MNKAYYYFYDVSVSFWYMMEKRCFLGKSNFWEIGFMYIVVCITYISENSMHLSYVSNWSVESSSYLPIDMSALHLKTFFKQQKIF